MLTSTSPAQTLQRCTLPQPPASDPLPPTPMPCAQVLIYNHALLSLWTEDVWLMVADVDEFLLTPQPTSLPQLLHECAGGQYHAQVYIARVPAFCTSCEPVRRALKARAQEISSSDSLQAAGAAEGPADAMVTAAGPEGYTNAGGSSATRVFSDSNTAASTGTSCATNAANLLSAQVQAACHLQAAAAAVSKAVPARITNASSASNATIATVAHSHFLARIVRPEAQTTVGNAKHSTDAVGDAANAATTTGMLRVTRPLSMEALLWMTALGGQAWGRFGGSHSVRDGPKGGQPISGEGEARGMEASVTPHPLLMYSFAADLLKHNLTHHGKAVARPPFMRTYRVHYGIPLPAPKHQPRSRHCDPAMAVWLHALSQTHPRRFIPDSHIDFMLPDQLNLLDSITAPEWFWPLLVPGANGPPP